MHATLGQSTPAEQESRRGGKKQHPKKYVFLQQSSLHCGHVEHRIAWLPTLQQQLPGRVDHQPDAQDIQPMAFDDHVASASFSSM